MAVMSSEPRLQRRRMSRAEFDALPREVRAEYVDGVALMSPPASPAHQVSAARLVRLLQDALPALYVAEQVGVELGDSLRIPDVVVFDELEEREWMHRPPVLVVEVLSPTTRSEDLVRKPREYLRGGIAHYWTLDRQAPSLTARTAGDDEWHVVLVLDAEQPRGRVEIAGHGQVEIDLLALV